MTVDDAKALPPSIFACDAVSEETVEVARSLQEENTDCTTLSSQSSCDAVDQCSWCRSAAVRSQCLSKDDAKSLPPSIFACDKLSAEQEMSLPPKKEHKKHENGMRDFMDTVKSVTGSE